MTGEKEAKIVIVAILSMHKDTQCHTKWNQEFGLKSETKFGRVWNVFVRSWNTNTDTRTVVEIGGKLKSKSGSSFLLSI